MNSVDFLHWLDGFLHGKDFISDVDLEVLHNKIQTVSEYTREPTTLPYIPPVQGPDLREPFIRCSGDTSPIECNQT